MGNLFFYQVVTTYTRGLISSSMVCNAPAIWTHDSYSLADNELGRQFTEIWCDTLTNLNCRLSRQAVREFAMRVVFQMSSEDSSQLIDSPAACKLGQHRALLHSEDDGMLRKFRPFALPGENWLRDLKTV